MDRSNSYRAVAAPGSSQTEIVNGLTPAYCRVALKAGAIFTRLASHGAD